MSISQLLNQIVQIGGNLGQSSIPFINYHALNIFQHHVKNSFPGIKVNS